MNRSTASIRITRVADNGELAKQMAPHMTNFGKALGARMQRTVPKRSWALHDTITADTEVNGNTVETTVGFGGGDVGYGLIVERGSSIQPAQPFARPAMLQSKAGDLNYSGDGPKTHGVVSASTRRARTRARGKR